jgi:predicted glycosyltransferase
MAETGRVFFWVQHLLGIGHMMRAACIARYLSERGWEVDLVSGGPPIRGLEIGSARLHQLPPVRAADASFSRLVYVDGKPLDDSIRTVRRDLLLRLFDGFDPNILILEHFPFGRNQFEFELGPLLMAAAERPSRPTIFASVREILVERRLEREAVTVTAIQKLFDTVLVHGDPAVIGLEASFRSAAQIAHKIVYTGYVGGVTAGKRPPPGIGENEIIVSAGGGAVGTKIMETAIDAAKTMPYTRRWRILLGAGAGPRAYRKLKTRAPEWVTVEPARSDFRTLLARCAVSVSQAGYNTVVDVLASNARAIFIPFANERETEQTLRAGCFEQRGLARVIPEAMLTPGRLATIITEAMASPKSIRKVKIDGEAEVDRILRAALQRRGAKA